MARKLVTQQPITSSEAKELLEENIDENTRLNPKIQMLLQSLSLTVRLDEKRALELKAKLLQEGLSDRTACQLVDVLPLSDTEIVAVAGSDPTVLSKKERILSLIKESRE